MWGGNWSSTVFLFIVVVLFQSSSGKLFKTTTGPQRMCYHDNQAQIKLQRSRQVKYNNHPFDKTDVNPTIRQVDKPGRRAEGVFQPIRVHVYFDEDRISSSLSASQVRFLKDDLLPAAVAWVTSTLSVVPVEGALLVERHCPFVYDFGDSTVCAEVAPETYCGSTSDPSSPLIPDSFLAETLVCEECFGDNCGGSDSVCETLPGGSGIGADYIIMVAALESPSCTDNVLAYAGACYVDHFDRPIMGRVNVCPSSLDASGDQWEKQLATMVHELTHALGFSSSLFAYFRDANGTPRTPRDEFGNPFVTEGYVCPNGNVFDIAVPSTDTLQVSEQNGVLTTHLVTPSVAAAARAHFGCDSLIGAEVENQSPGGGCWGSHWEMRLFPNEYMAPLLTHNSVYSALTLAFLQDSGWYEVSGAVAQPLHWGKSQGCGFAQNPCLTSGNPPLSDHQDHYCTVGSEDGCTLDRLAVGYCSVANYASPIPSAFRYFAGNAYVGGGIAALDYCPIYWPYSNGDCRVLANAPGLNYMGESYGAGSRCLSGSLNQRDSGSVLVYPMAFGCFNIQCDTDSLVITATRSDGNPAEYVTCTVDGEEMSVPGFTGTITCPPFSIVCAAGDMGCLNGCSGRGVCTAGQCLCSPGYRGEDCSEQICPNDCSDNGACHVATEQCVCDSGYSGDDCGVVGAGGDTFSAAVSSRPVSSSAAGGRGDEVVVALLRCCCTHALLLSLLVVGLPFFR